MQDNVQRSPCCLTLPLSGQPSHCTTSATHISLQPSFFFSPLTSPVCTRFLCVILTTCLTPSSLSLSWVLCFTEASSPNPLWQPYLNLPCYCSFHPTASTLSPLQSNSLLCPPPPPPPHPPSSLPDPFILPVNSL